MKTQRQQGDVCYEKIDKLPQGVKKLQRSNRGYVLAEGEATGHCHAIKDECELYEKDGVLYLVNENPVTLNHEEHHAQVIEPGIWEIGKISEYDYFTEMTRNVTD